MDILFFDFLSNLFSEIDAIVIVGIVFYFLYMFTKLLARRKERLMIVEKMSVNPDSFDLYQGKVKNKERMLYNWIKPASLIIGLGMGFLVTELMYNNISGYVGISLLLIFSGLGMLGGFFLERYLRKSDENKLSEKR